MKSEELTPAAPAVSVSSANKNKNEQAQSLHAAPRLLVIAGRPARESSHLLSPHPHAVHAVSSFVSLVRCALCVSSSPKNFKAASKWLLARINTQEGGRRGLQVL